MKELLLVCLGAMLVDNLLLAHYLGLDSLPDEPVSLRKVARSGLSVTLLMLVAAPLVYLVEAFIIARFDLWFARPIIILLVIAALIRIMGRWIRQLGNCAVTYSVLLGWALLTLAEGYSLGESLAYALGSGLGLTVVLVVLAGLLAELRLSNIPESFRGLPILFVVIGILALCFGGFCGMLRL
ncbi:MAG: hypothetical protein GX058_03310 [Firmicutes bacterium]|nr:hypothetical protein [Bacillota bacterium]